MSWLFLFSCQEQGASRDPIAKQPIAADTAYARQLFEKALGLSQANEFDSSVQVFDQALRIYEGELDKVYDSVTQIHYLQSMAVAADRGWALTGQADTALQILENALNKAVESFDSIHPTVAFIHRRLSNVHEIPKNMEETIFHLSEAGNIYKKSGHGFIANRVETYYQLAAFFGSMFKVKKAIKILKEEVLPLLQENPDLNLKEGPSIYTALAHFHYILKSNASSTYYFQKADSLLQLVSDPDPNVKARILSGLALIANIENNIESAIDYTKQAIDQLIRVYPENYYAITNFYDQLSLIYRKLGNSKKSLELLNYSFALKPPVEELRKYAGLDGNYLNFGLVYSDLFDFQKSLEFHRKALEQNRFYFKNRSPYEAAYIGNIGVAYYRLGQYHQAEEYFQKAIEKAKEDYVNPATKDYITSITQLRLGNLHYAKRNFEAAKVYYLKRLQSEDKVNRRSFFPDQGLIKHFRTLLLLGLTELQLMHFDNALSYFNQCTSLINEVQGYNLREQLMLNNSYAQYYIAKGEFAKALSFFEKTEMTFDLKVSNDESSHAEINSGSTGYLLEALKTGASLQQQMFYSDTSDLQLLSEALNRCKLFFSIQNDIYAGLDRQLSKDFIQSSNLDFTELSLQICLELFKQTRNEEYLQEALSFMEGSKSKSLREALNKQYAFELSDVPKTITDSIQNVQALIGYYEQQLLDSDSSVSRERKNQYQDRLFTLKNTRDQILRDIEKNYPDYYRLKYDDSLPSIADIQAYLPSAQTALIEFFRGDSTLFTLTIFQDTLLFHQQVLDTTFIHQLQSFRDYLSAGQLTVQPETAITKNLRQLSQAGFYLYQRLLAPVLTQNKEVDHLILIPDAELGYLPFDLLLTEAIPDDRLPNQREWPYLLKTFTLQHEYSARLLLQDQPENKKYTGQLLAFAPSFEPAGREEALTTKDSLSIPKAILSMRDGLAPLAYNQAEVASIQKNVGGKALAGKEATEAAFKAQADQFNILHLSTHTVLSDHHPNYSHLVFAKGNDSLNDRYLHAYELYNMRLNADLAVLSACETGVGKVQRGEGIMSLSRAFKYAGCPNIVTSLWKAEDQSTQEIMVVFYKKLKKGMGKAEALRQAKLDFLAQADQSRTPPFFWGAFILIGDDEPIKFPDYKLISLLSIIWVGLIIVGIRSIFSNFPE